jgi:hypothetical protein
LAAWKHSRQQLRLRLAWLRVFGDDARAIQRARTRLDALGWRGRGTAWQSTGSTADRDPGSAARNAARRTDSTRANCAARTNTEPNANTNLVFSMLVQSVACGDDGLRELLEAEAQTIWCMTADCR